MVANLLAVEKKDVAEALQKVSWVTNWKKYTEKRTTCTILDSIFAGIKCRDLCRNANLYHFFTVTSYLLLLAYDLLPVRYLDNH